MICDSEPYVKKTDLTFHLKKKTDWWTVSNIFQLGTFVFGLILNMSTRLSSHFLSFPNHNQVL